MSTDQSLGPPPAQAYCIYMGYDQALWVGEYGTSRLVKYDLDAGTDQRYGFGAGRYGSEAPFAPRTGAVGEDDGYLVSFVYDAATERSEVVILDAQDISAGPIGRVLLPVGVPNGFHACWVPAEDLESARPA